MLSVDVPILRHLLSGRAMPLGARAVVGRSAACTVVVDSSLASGEHATIWWSGARWEVKDLGSRNGTYLAERKLEPGRSYVLSPGAQIAFGDKQDLWALSDGSPPGPTALDLESHGLTGGHNGLLVLPTQSEPEASIYARASDGQWVIESADGEVREVADQAVVEVGGRRWRLQLPILLQGTPMADLGLTLEKVSLRFAVSKNEEHVSITIVHRDGEIPLEPREHGYLLLTLARARLGDVEHPTAERGWVDRETLLKMLNVSPTSFHVSTHRARQQLLDAGIEGATGIVEVRRGERRLGTDRVSIVPL